MISLQIERLGLSIKKKKKNNNNSGTTVPKRQTHFCCYRLIVDDNANRWLEVYTYKPKLDGNSPNAGQIVSMTMLPIKEKEDWQGINGQQDKAEKSEI